jgi:tetratricopeptide (TPR) repeat protein
MRTLFIVVCILLQLSFDLRAQESVAAARDLYNAASYEEALAVLNRLDSGNAESPDRMAVNQYRAFCLLALGRNQEAERAIEAVLTVDVLYRPADVTMSPRLRSAFAGVRHRILPSMVQQEYTRARATFDRRDFPSAVAQFDRVLQALSDPDLGGAAGNPPLADLRTLAAGFRDLSIKASAPSPAPAPPPAPVAMPVSRVVGTIFNGTEIGVTPAVTVRQVLPNYHGDLSALRDGVLEVIISETGDVESAVMKSPVTPRYDSTLLAAAKGWKYHPATLNGRPVKFRKIINISIKPEAKGPFVRPVPAARR